MNLKAMLVTLTGVTTLAGTSMVMAGIVDDPVIWDNGPAAGGGAYSSQLDAVYPFHSQTADDFQFQTAMNVTDVHWTGVWFNGAALPNTSTNFNIFFYASNAAGTAPTGGPGDPSGTALASYTTGLGGANQVPGAPGTFDYSFVLPVAFVAAANTHYWIAIQSINTYPPQWGWSISTLDQLSEARLGFPLLAIPYWSDPAAATLDDVSFKLTGTAVPAPGVLALLGLAGIVSRRRRA